MRQIARRMNGRNFFALVRWLRWKLQYRNLRGGPFFCGFGSTVKLGPRATVHVGREFVAVRSFTAYFGGKADIGRSVFFNEGCHISCLSDLKIGDDCLFGEQVSIHDDDHNFGPDYVDVPVRKRGFTVAPIIIGSNVWIGAKATVVRGVTIGDGAVIGAHALVTRDVPARSLALGTPARVVKSW